MVTRIRFHELRELAVRPVETAFFHDDAADTGRMAVDIFRGGMRHDVRAELKRTAEERGRKSVVHDQRKSVFVSDFRHFFDIQHNQGGIRKHLGKDSLGIRADRRLKLLRRRFRQDKGKLHAHFLQCIGKQGDRSAVKTGNRDNMVAAARNIHDRQRIRVLPGARRNGGNASFQRGDLLFKTVHRRIGEAGIEKPGALQIEQIGDALRIVVFISCALGNRHNTRTAVFGSISGLNSQRFKFQFLIHGSISFFQKQQYIFF